MGLDFNLDVGAYLECYNEKVEVDKMGKICCGKKYQINSEFCSNCGKKLKEIVIGAIKSSKINVSEIYEKTGNLFYRIPTEDNEITDGSIDIWNRGTINRKDITILDLTSDKIKQDYMKKFMEENKKGIKIIQDIYGKENVQIKFGVISYYS